MRGNRRRYHPGGLEALKARSVVDEESDEDAKGGSVTKRGATIQLATIASCKSSIIVIYTAHHPMLIITKRSVTPRPRKKNEFTNAHTATPEFTSLAEGKVPRTEGVRVALKYPPFFFLFVSVFSFLFLSFFLFLPLLLE